MSRIIITREYKEGVTIGSLDLYTDTVLKFQCKTLELPWKDNQNNISCIPEGEYLLKSRWSPKYKNHLHILNPDGSEIAPRALCLIHPANYVRQLRGCIAVGRGHADIDGDGKIDVTSSKNTLAELLTYTGEFTYLTIKS